MQIHYNLINLTQILILMKLINKSLNNNYHNNNR